MIAITLLFGDTMPLNYRGGGAVTPPQCATSVLSSTEIAQAIVDNIQLPTSNQLPSTCRLYEDSETGVIRGRFIPRVSIQRDHRMFPPRDTRRALSEDACDPYL